MFDSQHAAGRVTEVPISGSYQMVRMLPRSALQAALRQQGLVWGALAEAAVDLDQREAFAAGFDEVPR